MHRFARSGFRVAGQTPPGRVLNSRREISEHNFRVADDTSSKSAADTCWFPKGNVLGWCCTCWKPKENAMKEKTDVRQGTLALMVLKTLDVLGPLHGYGIARRIEQISGELLAVNQGTLYPVLLKLEQEGAITSEWGASENNRKARYYRLMRAGRKQLQSETRDWEQTAEIIGRFFAVKAEDLQ
jgi:PadR family transcriptional regulator, regulatory protein PadR